MERPKIENYKLGKGFHTHDFVSDLTLYIDQLESEKKVQAEFIPMQKCPKCDGQGIVSKPPWIAGDQTTWDDNTSTSHQCNVCNGNKIIPMQIKK